jgi:DNA-binding response OmpR family regulator
MRIMFVEDNLEVLDLYQSFIDDSRHSCKFFSNSIQALDFFKKDINRVELAILDVKLPNMNGIELAEELIKLKNIPIIFSTAFLDWEEIKYVKSKFNNPIILLKPDCFSSLEKSISQIEKRSKE